MGANFTDITSIMQVIGCVYNNPQLLSFSDKYIITDEDFPDEFHRIVFGTIYNLYSLGATSINLLNIHDFLEARPKSKAIYEREKGE